MITAVSAATIHSVARARQPYSVTRDPHSEAERLPALLDDDELSPELVLVDPDVAERARDALPDITLTEIRFSFSLKVQQMPAPAAPRSVPEPVVVAETATTPAPAPIVTRPADAPAPPSYEEIPRVFHEPRIDPVRFRRFLPAGLVVLGVAAGVALALPRGLDGPTSQSSANSNSSKPDSAAAPGVHRPKSKGTSYAKPEAHKKRATSPTRHPPPAPKAKRAPKKHVAAPPPVTSRHVSKPKQKRVVRPHVRMIPDFVWVPVKGARGYLVEFLTGSKVVFRAHTRGARLRLSAKQLHRGSYRWLVWQLGEAGAPIGKPLVDSKVTVR
jgi:hypothetical protein